MNDWNLFALLIWMFLVCVYIVFYFLLLGIICLFSVVFDMVVVYFGCLWLFCFGLWCYVCLFRSNCFVLFWCFVLWWFAVHLLMACLGLTLLLTDLMLLVWLYSYVLLNVCLDWCGLGYLCWVLFCCYLVRCLL